MLNAMEDSSFAGSWTDPAGLVERLQRESKWLAWFHFSSVLVTKDGVRIGNWIY
jgi:hypothetical protein